MNRSSAVPAALFGLVLLAPFAPVPAYAAVPASQQGSYHPVSAARLLDTRASGTALNSRTPLTLQVTGKATLPTSGVAAVVINVTATRVSANGYLSVYPSSPNRPAVSTLNTGAGRTTANTAIVPVSSTGKIDIYNSAGSADVIVDISGWYAGSGTGTTATGGTDYLPQEPVRVFDTRADAPGPLASGYAFTAGVSFGDKASNSNVRALAINLTATGGGAGGYLTAWDGVNPSPPKISGLNYQKSIAVANTAVVRSRHDSTQQDAPVFDVYNGGSKPVNVIVDVVGVYVDTTSEEATGLRFVPITPKRILDSRTTKKPLTAKSQRTVSASTVAKSTTISLAANLTAVGPTASTYLTVWPSDERPASSNLNAPAGRTVANGAVLDLYASTNFQIYNYAGSTNILIDVTGRFEPAPYADGATSQHRLTAPTRQSGMTRR